MDILEESFGEASTQPVESLENMVEIRPERPTSLPQPAVRNRAATSAILTSDPDKLVDTYRLMMQEASEGIEVTHQQAMKSLEERNKSKSMKHVIALLGDTSIPLEQKKKLMEFVQTNGFKEDPAVTLQSNALAAESKGDDLRGEAARISTADVMGEMKKEREDRQRLVNGMMASMPDVSTAHLVKDISAAEVMPFGRNKIAADVAEAVRGQEGVPTSLGRWVKDFLLPGSTKRDLQAKLNSIPPQKREAYTKSLIAGIKAEGGVFHNENYYAQYATALSVLSSPEHSNVQVWTENMMTVLDGLWVGGEIRAVKNAVVGGKLAQDFTSAASRARRPGSASPGVSDAEYVEKATWELVDPPYNPNQIPSNTKRLAGPTKVDDAAKRIEMNAVVHRNNPASPYSVVEQVNPAQARAFHEGILNSTNDELAEAVAGVSREQALANNTFPQVATDSGNVLYKVNQDVKEILTNTGATRYTAGEFEEASAVVQRDFRNATGLEVNDAMTTIKVDGDHMLIDAHYSTAGGSFTTATEAREQAKFALKQYGIRDDEIVIMKREGMDFVPATDNLPGEYMVKVKTSVPITDDMVENWNPLDVKRNWTDRISQTGSEDKGNISGWLMDPGSMLHPTLTGSASIVADQAINIENVLLKPIKELRTQLASFGKTRMRAIEEYMIEANTKGLKHDAFDLTARGFSADEIGALAKWKDIWDGHYYLENYDLVRTLHSQGFELLENAGTKLFARPLLQKNQNIGKVLDQSQNKVVNLTKQEMDDLYAKGGYYATLRRPIDVSGDLVEHVIVRNTPTEYLRKVRDTDAVLNYREGYFTINYKAAKFVDELTEVGGKTVRRTVAVAGNTADAEMFINSQTAASGNKHVMREDSRGFKKDGDGYWDLNESSGRIAQRLRGKPLTQATGINTLGAGSFIENPMKSAVRAAQSLAGRSVSRPTLETAKRRFVSQYADFLPSDNMGGKRYPANRSEIVDHGSHTSSQIADARTTYGYINFLEQGYINSADQVFKGGMNVLADLLGKYHLSTAERVARTVGDVAPTNAAKATVFQAYIAMSNPIRQWIVQSHQAGRMVAYNPIGFINGGFAERMAGYLHVASGLGTPNKLASDFHKFVTDSGMVAGVDRNSLVRGLGLSMADSSSTTVRGIGQVASLPQTIGFDIGEKVNQLGHLAAVHEKWMRAGKDLTDKTVRDLALTEARALSYDLNKAGELTYTQSTPAMILQFLQMPHKAMLQLTNRKVPTPVAARLAAWDLIMWGAPIGTISAIAMAVGADGEGVLPDDEELREKVVYGLESYYLNQMFSQMDDSGEKSRIDFSALAPNDMDGWARMYHALADDGVFGAFAASPAGQLFAVDGVNGSRRNGRIPTAMITMGRFFNVVDEVEPMEPTEFSAVLNDMAKITSGWTAASNAMVMLETRKKVDAMGATVDSTLTTPEIIAAFLGFGTKSTKELYEISKHAAKSKKAHDEDVLSRYRDIMTYYKEKLAVEGSDIKHIQRVSSMLMSTFKDPYDLALVKSQWQKDMIGPEANLLKMMVERSGHPSLDKTMDDIRMAPLPDDDKARLMQRVKDLREIRETNEGR
jgi:hypothetical protein